jgi:hypothetical protein
MSIPFDQKLEKYRRLCEAYPDNHDYCYEYNLTLLRSGRLTFQDIIDKKEEIVKSGNASLPLLEILLGSKEHRIHGIIILIRINTKESFSRAFNQVSREKDIYEKEFYLYHMCWFRFNTGDFDDEFEKLINLVYEMINNHQKAVGSLGVLISTERERMFGMFGALDVFTEPLEKVIESKNEETLGSNAEQAARILSDFPS